MTPQELFVVIRLGLFSIVSIMLGIGVAVGLRFVPPRRLATLQLRDGDLRENRPLKKAA